MPRQISLFSQLPKKGQTKLKSQPRFGGGLKLEIRGRKGSRPLARNKWTHLILRSDHFKGEKSLTRSRERVSSVIAREAKRAGLVIRQIVLVGNHAHLQIKISHRSIYNRFIRAVTSMIAGLLKSNWTHRPYTRVLFTYKEEKVLDRYFDLNALEATHGPEVRKMHEEMRKGLWMNGWMRI